MNIKKWYVEKFPSDELGHEIKDDVTFSELFEDLVNNNDFYGFIGEGIDSIIRERLFEELARINGVGYDYIYRLWLNRH